METDLRLRPHPESGRNVQDPVGNEDSSAAGPRMQSSSRAGESSSTQPQAQEPGKPEDALAGPPEGADPGKPGDPPDSAAEGASGRGNPETYRRRSRKMKEPGQPGASSKALREERRNGATRRFNSPQR
jgi:hypothetical protein